MNESELELDSNVIGKDQSDWQMDTIAEQVWNDLSGDVTRSTIKEMLTEIAPRYEEARIQTFVPIFIRRDVAKRLRAMRAPIASPVLDEAEIIRHAG